MASPVPHRTLTIAGVLRNPHTGAAYTPTMHVVTLADHRPSAPAAPREWLFQSQLEDVLYPSVLTMGTAGAFYRLLLRSGAGGMSLSLRRNSVAANLTEPEFDALKALLHTGVRVFTLVPLDAVTTALATYGRAPASAALMDALGLPHPAEWAAEGGQQEDAVMEEPGGEEGEEEGEEGGEEENEDEEDEEEEGGGSSSGEGHGEGGASGSGDASGSHNPSGTSGSEGAVG